MLGADINPLNTELNPICHLLAFLGGAIIVVVSRLRVKQHHAHLLHGAWLDTRTKGSLLGSQSLHAHTF
jgi:hypothetical protein